MNFPYIISWVPAHNIQKTLNDDVIFRCGGGWHTAPAPDAVQKSGVFHELANQLKYWWCMWLLMLCNNTKKNTYWWWKIFKNGHHHYYSARIFHFRCLWLIKIYFLNHNLFEKILNILRSFWDLFYVDFIINYLSIDLQIFSSNISFIIFLFSYFLESSRTEAILDSTQQAISDVAPLRININDIISLFRLIC
jgi:hypothetical protein